MFRFLLRTLGFVLLAAAFAALVVDGSRSIAGGRVLFYPVADFAALLDGGRAPEALAGVAGWPAPARDALAALLAAPGSAIVGAVGLLLLYGGRPPSAEPGFAGRRS